jgi:hypothetical protein
LTEAESKIEKVTELVKMVQARLLQAVRDAPKEVVEGYRGLLEEAKSIATV